MEEIDGDWIKARLGNEWGQVTQLAEAIGIGPDKVSKILHGKRQVQAREVPHILAFFESRTGTTTATPGLSESDATPYRPPTNMQQLFASLAPDARALDGYRASRPLISFGILAGDVLVVDLGSEPAMNDLVVSTTADVDTGNAQTNIRRYCGTVLIPDSIDQTPESLGDDSQTAVLGIVRGVIRGGKA